MVLKFAKINPTQNMTVLVTSPVPREMQPYLAARLMAYEGVGAEQVGYLEPTTMEGAVRRLQMMGGEFCGNASISAAALIAHESGIADGASMEIPLEVSGAPKPVVCRVTSHGEGFRAKVDMPLPKWIREVEFAPNMRFPVVAFDGIVHVIVPANLLTPAKARRALLEWSERLNADAMGVLLVDWANLRMRPLVGVRATGSLVWERGCASGTAALGAYAAISAQKSASIRVDQPGGVIQADAEYRGGEIERLSIDGEVKIAAIGEAYV